MTASSWFYAIVTGLAWLVGFGIWVFSEGLRKLFLWLVPVLRVFAFGRKFMFITDVTGRRVLYMSRFYMTPRADWWRKRFRDYYLHNIHIPDGVRELHNHPYCASESTILRGGYYEVREGLPERVYLPGDRNLLTPKDFHRITELIGDTWTLFRAGARTGNGWGFKNEAGYSPVDYA